ncbi:hypothetical protein ACF0H5_008660 [Mactra antiquata]
MYFITVNTYIPDLTRGEWIENGDERKFVVCVNSTYVYMYDGSLIGLPGIDVIVNPTNASLSHAGGIAAYIAKAAGRDMINECESRVKDFGNLQVKENFVSTAGDLPYKGIINVVGPGWGDYHGQRARCAKHLYNTIINALMQVSSNGWTTVAIPAISSGGLGVPKELCAEMYVKAFIDFTVSGPVGIREIHFVDKNKDIIELTCTTYEKAYENPDVLDFKNAENYPEPPAKTTTVTEPFQVTGNITRPHKPFQVTGKKTLPHKPFQVTGNKTRPHIRVPRPNFSALLQANSEKYSFTIGNLTIHVYHQSITTVQGMDGIVNSTITTLQHRCGVAKDIATAAGDAVTQECNDYVKANGNLQVTENFISSGGNLSCTGIIHAVGPQWDETKQDKCARDLRITVVNALKSAKKRNWGKIAMTAMSSKHSGLPRDVCTTEYLNAFEEFSSSGTGSLTEVHFIDTDQKILDLLVDKHKSSA